MGADMWEYQMLGLSERGVRCIAYDLRGCGRSDQPGTGYDFDTLSDDLAALIAHLDLRAVTLVGYSLGAGVIARCLTRHGAGRVARAALVSPVTPYLLKTEDNPEGMERGLVYDPFQAGLLSDRPRLFADLAPAFFGAAVSDGAASPEAVEWAIRLCDRASPRATLDLFRTAYEIDLRPDMAAFTMPTLVLHGDSDPFAPVVATGRRTADAIPGSRLEVYEGGAHGLFLTHRDRLNADLLHFIQAR
jgi:pimeloyl-ACP methyl ester carboxylesterase